MESVKHKVFLFLLLSLQRKRRKWIIKINWSLKIRNKKERITWNKKKLFSKFKQKLPHAKVPQIKWEQNLFHSQNDAQTVLTKKISQEKRREQRGNKKIEEKKNEDFNCIVEDTPTSWSTRSSWESRETFWEWVWFLVRDDTLPFLN